MLYIAEYSPIPTGYHVVALNLRSGKQIWKSRLQALGPIRHSKYNDGRYIIITGNESRGRYVEQLDAKSGRTLASKKLAADPKSLW